MKTMIFGAFALAFAVPAAAQTAPAADPHTDHAQHKGMDHAKGKHDCKECCEKMKGKDGKMECMDKKAEAAPAQSQADHQDHSEH